MTKKEQIRKCQEIRDKYKDGEFLKGEDFDFLFSIFRKHRWYADKTKGQAHWFYVDTSKEYKTRCFFIEREDGTTTDFSFYECIYPTKVYRQDFNKAARKAIEQDIINFRNEYFSFSNVLICPLCKSEMSKNNSHIDHYPVKFRDILNDFIKEYGIKDFQTITEPEDWDNINGVEITDSEIKYKWIEYHNSKEKLRAICPNCNLRLG
ncbi:DCL family protein [Candidatus Pacearchaeota archaeon]|nr:DCL family protein [Candidatus Pacearchaeota archaeon]